VWCRRRAGAYLSAPLVSPLTLMIPSSLAIPKPLRPPSIYTRVSFICSIADKMLQASQPAMAAAFFRPKESAWLRKSLVTSLMQTL
jgi:hypothetical protein